MVQFEELGIPERILLLKAFDYGVDEEGFILDPQGSKIRSDEDPKKYLTVEEAMIVSYTSIDYLEDRRTLEVLDGTPTSISKFLRGVKEAEDEKDAIESQRWRERKRMELMMGWPTFFLYYKTSPISIGIGETASQHKFKAANLNDAKKKGSEFLRSIVLPTDRPGVSVRWAYLKRTGDVGKVWLIQEAKESDF